MKTIQLHPLSLLVGLAGGVGGLLLMSQSAVTTLPTARVEVGPHPRDMVQIIGGQPYTVPTGKILTITGLGTVQGTNQPNVDARLLINGQEQARMYLTDLTGTVGSTVGTVPAGLTARWGDVITMSDYVGSPLPNGRAWGYLADR